MSEFTYWSSTFGEEVSRLSMADACGAEYYCFVPFGSGKSLRNLRRMAASALLDAIESGQSPGEVEWSHNQ